MTAATWLAVAAALRLWPAPSAAVLRWRALVGRTTAGAVAAGPAARGRWRRWGRRRDPAVGDAAVLTALRALHADLAAGARPAEALEAARSADPTLAAAFGEAVTAAHTAGEVGTSLGRSPALRGLAVAWRLAETAGVPLSRVVDGVITDLADRLEQRRAVGAALAGPRSSAALLAGLPALGLLLAAGMGGRPLAFLTGSATGRLVGAAGLLFDAAGLLWTLRLARSAQRP